LPISIVDWRSDWRLAIGLRLPVDRLTQPAKLHKNRHSPNSNRQSSFFNPIVNLQSESPIDSRQSVNRQSAVVNLKFGSVQAAILPEFRQPLENPADFAGHRACDPATH